MMLRTATFALAVLISLPPRAQADTATAVAGPATAGQGIPLTSTPTLEGLSYLPSRAKTGVPDLRAQLLSDAARTMGFRGGMAARTQELLAALNRRGDNLSTMFSFAPLMSTWGTVPPVIEAAQDLAAFSTDQVRTANKAYKIAREERFVSVPPSWRDYLLVGLPITGKVELPELHARPQDAQEEAIWKAAVQDGWARGTKQADAILEANFHRLVRDYTGMVTYAVLLQQGMISKTRVAESIQTVTGDGTQISLGDSLRRVTSKARFQTDPRQWRPTIATVPQRTVPSASAGASASQP